MAREALSLALSAVGLVLLTGMPCAGQESPPQAEKASPAARPEGPIQKGLMWLARHQAPEGHWGAEAWPRRCVGTPCPGPGKESGDVGVTGLALLAFLGAGYSPLYMGEFRDPALPERLYRFGEVAKKGLDWLVRRQDREGCLPARQDSKYMYSHAIGTMALCEALSNTKAEYLKEPARRAVDFLAQARNPGKGWRYSARSGDNDTSVTTWCVMALRDAEVAGLTFEKAAYEGALAWYDEVTEEGYPRAGYTFKGVGGFIPGLGMEFEHHETLSACACLARCIIKRDKKDPALEALQLLKKDPPSCDKLFIDYCYWFFGSAALCIYEGPKGEGWKPWRNALERALVPNQSAAMGCVQGSWDIADKWSSAYEAGRVYATALNLITLEILGKEPGILKLKQGLER